jgi:hypothetical protein
MDDLIERLKLSYATASNDDYSKPATMGRERHVARLAAISDAIAELAALRTECDALRADAARFLKLAKAVTGEEWERISGQWPTSDDPEEYRAAIEATLQGQSNA